MFLTKTCLPILNQNEACSTNIECTIQNFNKTNKKLSLPCWKIFPTGIFIFLYNLPKNLWNISGHSTLDFLHESRSISLFIAISSPRWAGNWAHRTSLSKLKMYFSLNNFSLPLDPANSRTHYYIAHYPTYCSPPLTHRTSTIPPCPSWCQESPRKKRILRCFPKLDLLNVSVDSLPNLTFHLFA